MGFFDLFRNKSAAAGAQQRPQANATGQFFTGLDDPDLADYLRGSSTESGAYVTAKKSLQNMTVLRCVMLISEAIGMLPLNLHKTGPQREKAEDHPVYKLLKSKPNAWQTAYEFKSTMQARALLHGNAYAMIVRSGGRIYRLVPLDSNRVEPILQDDFTLIYRYTKPAGGTMDMRAEDVFHLRDLSEDGVIGLSRVKLAREAIGLAMQAENAAARLFKNGMMVGGALKHPGTLSTEAYERLQQSMADRYSGSANAHKWMVLEEGMGAEQFAQTASDSQHIENRSHQIEEIARAFGVPRPLLMMDETSWGSGIDALGLYFVQYTLAPWFTAWEQAIERSLLSPAEAGQYYAKFNERALLRGGMKDQAEFFAKALGAGGHQPWMTANEVRSLSDLPESDDPNADELANPMTQQPAATPQPAQDDSAPPPV